MRNKVVSCSDPSHSVIVYIQYRDFHILTCGHLLFKLCVYQKDIQIVKIYSDGEWSTQMPGTLLNVSSLVGFPMPEKGIRHRPLNANHSAASIQHI